MLQDPDYPQSIVLKRGIATLISCAWERQWAVFINGRCVHTENNRKAAFAYLHRNKD